MEAALLPQLAVAVARVDPEALVVMAVTVLVPVVPAVAAAAARVDRHPPLAQREHLPLAVLAVQGGLQALVVLEPRQLQAPPKALTAAVAALDLVVLHHTGLVPWGL